MFAEGRGTMVTLRLMEVENADMRTMESPCDIIAHAQVHRAAGEVSRAHARPVYVYR